jgi:4-hydroxyphenylpyruvate dioxygenase
MSNPHPPPRRRAIATVCLSGTLPDKLEAAALAGFDAVEIFEPDLLLFDGTARDVRRIAGDLGLEIVLLQPLRNFEGLPEPKRSRAFALAERKFDLMAELGTDLLLVCSSLDAEASGDRARIAADLAELAERAARRGLRIGYEALAFGAHIRHWHEAWEVVQRANHPALGLILDSFHLFALGDDPAPIAALPGARIFFVQLADAPKLTLDPTTWSRHYRNFPGQGDFPLAGFLRAVAASGYAGPLSLEVFNDEFRASAPRPTAQDAIRGLIALEAEAGLTPLPPPPALEGVGFVEFALDPGAAAETARLLTTLGFARLGHIAAEPGAEVYGAGGIRFILNTAAEGLAHGHFLRHGPSVAALGLVVDDAAATLARAEGLHVSLWREPLGAFSLPALRAPDGLLLYLLEKDAVAGFWQAALIAETAPNPPPEPRWERIDHLAIALPAGAMDRFVLFYRSVFGLLPGPRTDLPDRFGLIQSRPLENREKTFRLPLNVSESPATATGRFVATHGPGVQHIALAARDIFGLADSLSARGFTPLAVTANYYEDLAAASGLDAAEIAKLAARNLLYDRDGGGEFYHFYSPAIPGGLFFEGLERRGYQGYGAANAPFRLAAQRRGEG